MLQDVFGEELSADSFDYREGRDKVFDHVKRYKFDVITNMEAHVKQLMAEDSIMKEYNTTALLQHTFEKTFNEVNFLFVWSFLEGYLDFDGCSELGKYYMKGIYVNLAIEVKLYLDSIERLPITKPTVRKQLTDFYDTLPLHPDFQGVHMSDFKELNARSYRQKKKKPAKQPDRSGLNRMVSMGPPPPKASSGSGPGLGLGGAVVHGNGN
ncbi:MAG: hypothetical protein Q9200_006454 [Gallowayella weberi]